MFNRLRHTLFRFTQTTQAGPSTRSRPDVALLATMATMGCMASFKLGHKAHCEELKVCPVQHTARAQASTSVDVEKGTAAHVSQASASESQAQPVAANASAGVCPVNHGKIPVSNQAAAAIAVENTSAESPATSRTGAAGVCPVKSTSTSTPAGGFTQMASAMRQKKASETVTSGTHGSYEPRDTESDRFVAPYDPAKVQAIEDQAQGAFAGIHNAHLIPGGKIPATGRGNSSDGADWVNPTPAELFRALRRKNKPIEEEDAWSVAFVHSVVVDQTWAQILEYEELHKDECSEPTLASFEGKYGEDSIKTMIFNKFYPSMVPFDRHDWYIDRCGKKVRYIIDYYAMEDPDGTQTYAVDARPEPTFEGMRDRAIVAAKRWWRGDSVW